MLWVITGYGLSQYGLSQVWLYKQHKQGIYVDGHERNDVVEYRKEFLAEMKELVFTVCKLR